MRAIFSYFQPSCPEDKDLDDKVWCLLLRVTLGWGTGNLVKAGGSRFKVVGPRWGEREFLLELVPKDQGNFLLPTPPSTYSV